MKLASGVAPDGSFRVGIHQPALSVSNFRAKDHIEALGRCANGKLRTNQVNFPPGTVEAETTDWVYEIPNAFPFRGTTFIARSWAQECAQSPLSLALPTPTPTSFSSTIESWAHDRPFMESEVEAIFKRLPSAVKLALATTSTDQRDLIRLAHDCCKLQLDGQGRPTGLLFKQNPDGSYYPEIEDHDLFEAVANSPYLPPSYKVAMVLRPGIQGDSPIVGEWFDAKADSHIFEYLRQNSYIPWGHYAANMAHDAIRYSTAELSCTDMQGLRHLYYQRTFTRLAEMLGVRVAGDRQNLSPSSLEKLRVVINERLADSQLGPNLTFNCTLWGWNYGFDFAPSRYRLHASHQQIHQQFALLPDKVRCLDRNGKAASDRWMSSYACGDQIAAFTADYRERCGQPFFETYLKAIRDNVRMDGRDQRPRSLIVFENEAAIVFVPKAQTSQWELQVMLTRPVGHILEADAQTRTQIDHALWVAIRILGELGARMVTSIEYAKRFQNPDTDQRLLYALLPKLPQSPGGFSEAQLRWIVGHFPEDFAVACRNHLERLGI
jgi:hypothetical protein